MNSVLRNDPISHPRLSAKHEAHAASCSSRRAFPADANGGSAMETLRFTGGVIQDGVHGKCLPDNPDGSLSRTWNYDLFKWKIQGQPAVRHVPVALAVITPGLPFVSSASLPFGYLCGQTYATTLFILQLINNLKITSVDGIMAVVDEMHTKSVEAHMKEHTHMTVDEKKHYTSGLLSLLKTAKNQPKV